MSPFPAVDPIPLPAPVWLFKALSDVTLTLHFLAVQALLGGYLVALFWNFRGHTAGRKDMIEGSGAVAGWLPIIMTYVINLGVPPLLFAQVLYGRALYTSSVLIGPYWIAVIPLLIACYHLLYVMKYRSHEGKAWWGVGIISFLLAATIAKILAVNMTLMQKPEMWLEMYRNDPTGATYPPMHGAWLPRWAAMFAAGIATAGVMLAWIARSSEYAEETRGMLHRCGSWTGVIGVTAAFIAGGWVWTAQPEAVRSACAEGSLWLPSVVLWIGGAALAVIVCGLRLQPGKEISFGWKTPLAFGLAIFLQTAGLVLLRDQIRDATLGLSGYDVWDRKVVVNWSVLGLFLFLFVAGLGVLAWLGWVASKMAPAPRSEEA